MSLSELHERHILRTTNLLFDCSHGSLPVWLCEQAQRCAKHYAGVQTTPEFQATLKAFSSRHSEPFELFVVGEGNFGKSTLINALLGTEVSKVARLPETRVFHRFILARTPRTTARIFARLDARMHEWLLPALGRGEPAAGFFDLQEFQVPMAEAIELVRRETELLNGAGDRPNYQAAIFEIEHDIQWTEDSRFPEKVRIVDTQGLNQHLPGDIAEILETNPSRETGALVVRWLHETVRGRHLLWQYRRCDAALWLLHAAMAQSKATQTLFPIFAAYGKKSVMAVTNVDHFPREYDRERILAWVRGHYGGAVHCVIPVDGRSGLRAVLARDEELESQSGVLELRREVTRICVGDGLRTRSVGLYNALRVTESDLRRALLRFRNDLTALIENLDEVRVEVSALQVQTLSALEERLLKLQREGEETMSARIESIGLMDNASSANQKVGFAALTVQFQTQARSTLQEFQREIERLIGRISGTTFELPTFDPRGERCGRSVCVKVSLSFKHFNVEVPRGISVNIEGRAWGTAISSGLKWLFGIFSSQKRREAEAEMQRERAKRQLEAHRTFDPAWKRLTHSVLTCAETDVKESITAILQAIDEAERELATVEGESLRRTKSRLELMLSTRVTLPAVATHFVNAIRHVARQSVRAVFSESRKH